MFLTACAARRESRLRGARRGCSSGCGFRCASVLFVLTVFDAYIGIRESVRSRASIEPLFTLIDSLANIPRSLPRSLPHSTAEASATASLARALVLTAPGKEKKRSFGSYFSSSGCSVS